MTILYIDKFTNKLDILYVCVYINCTCVFTALTPRYFKMSNR